MSRILPQRFPQDTFPKKYDKDLLEVYEFYNEKCDILVPGVKTEKYSTGIPKILRKEQPCLCLDETQDVVRTRKAVQQDLKYLLYTMPAYGVIEPNYLVRYLGNIYRISKLRTVHKFKSDKIGEYELALI